MAPGRPRITSLPSLASRRRIKSPGPPSPTFSEATQASAIHFGLNVAPEKIITRTHLKSSLQAYDDLVNTCASYRAALLAMSKATAAFADALSTCAGLKGPSYEASTRLQVASGLHHLIGNQWHVLAETLDRKFEKPMRQHLDSYQAVVKERSVTYEQALREKSQAIRNTEARNMNRKERNLQSFREALAVLQRQVDDLDDLKAAHYQEIMEHEEEVWDAVQGKVCLVVRSTMDVFDRFTSKASDPIIEPMLQLVPDPFDSYGPPQAEDQIFSILPPLSIMTSTSSAASPLTQTPEPEGFQELPAVPGHATPSWITSSSITFPSRTEENMDGSSTTSASSPTSSMRTPTSSPPRSLSPSTPMPPRRQSSPPSASLGHNPRKSDSPTKLRSVLSVINESLAPQHHQQVDDGDSSPSGVYVSTRSASAPVTATDCRWDPAPVETPASNSTIVNCDDDSTPRHSMVLPESPPEHSVLKDVGQLNENTLHVPLSA